MLYLLLKVVGPGDSGSLLVAAEVNTTSERRKEIIQRGRQSGECQPGMARRQRCQQSVMRRVFNVTHE